MRNLLQRSRPEPEREPETLTLNEPLRLAALLRYDVLDTLPEPVFDDLTALAARVCDSPLAGITFVDEKRLWFKSRLGFSEPEFPRHAGPCAETILNTDLLVVEDARKAARFAQSPFVAMEPHLRFYAGIPLRTNDGFNIGTLWVADSRKRRLSAQAKDALRILSHQVMTQLELRRHLVELERSLSEHRRTQTALKDSEAFYQALVETLPQNILRKDTKGRFVFANGKFCGSLGKKVDEVLGKTDWDFFPAHLAEKYHRDDLRVIATREPIDTIEAHQTPSGERTYVHVIKTPLYDAAGNVVGIQGIYWDVTERKKTEEALAYERDLLRALLENIPDRIYFKDVQSRFLRISSSMARRLGVKEPRDAIGKSDFDFYPHELAKEFYSDEQRIITTGQPLINKLEQIIDFDGRVSWASVTKVPLQNRAGHVVGIIGISRDVTKLKEAETALAGARDAALETARVKSQFLANMSHEIRTPMNAIVGMTDLLFDTSLTTEQREFVDTIRGGTEALLAIINDILDYSKLDAGKLNVETLDFDLREVIEHTAELLAQRAQSKGIELAYSIDVEVPTLLRGDPGRIAQVLSNFVSNAVKFTSKGDVLIRVQLDRDTSDEAIIRISVTDTGIGIDSAKLPLIFQSFTQADGSTSRKYGGTGLGLAISKQLVELMHGKIGVESVPSRGSTFWFTLPLQKQPHQAAPTDPGDIRQLRVLVVEQSTAGRGVLVDQLRRWDLRPDGVSTTTEALERLRSAAQSGDPYHLAIVDIQIPEGLALARTIRGEELIHSTRVVVITPLGNRPDEELMETHGIAASIPKPVRQSRLFDALANAWHHQDGPAPVPEPPAEPAPALPPFSSIRILLAEDNLVNQRLALRQLQKLGYTAQAAGNGFEVLEEVRRADYDIILMDCQMPELDGYDVTRSIRQLEKESGKDPAYIIAVTAHALEGDRERCVSAGMNDYITKPVHLDQLDAALRRGVKKKVGGAAARSATILDPVCLAGLKDLREPGQPDPLVELFSLFAHESAGTARTISQSAAAENSAATAHAAHALKGSASNLGATQLAALCLQIEQAAKASKWPSVHPLVAQLDSELDRARKAFELEIASDPPKQAQ